MIGNANDKDLLKRQYYQQQMLQPVTLTQTQQNNSKVGVPLEKTLGRSDYGGSHWDQMYFTDDELLNSYNTRNAADRGEITWDDAHRYVENIRKKYGYSGGTDGSQYLPVQALGTPIRTDSWEHTVSDVTQNMADFEDYTSPIRAELAAKNAAVMERQPFSYDPATDPVYQAYQKQYAREGARATEDTLGQYAAMTGGMPSTAAVTAAQQAGDYYAAQMSDKIPELYKLAYSMYADEADRNLSELNAYRNWDSDLYGRYLDRWGMLGDAYSMASGERSYADSRADADKKAAKSEVDAILARGGTPSSDLLERSGYSQEYADSQGMQDVFSRLKNLGVTDAETAYMFLLQMGYTSGEASTLAASFEQMQGGGSVPGGYVPVTGGESISNVLWSQIYSSARTDPQTAAALLQQYWDRLSKGQKEMLAVEAGISYNDIVKNGGMESIGLDDFTDWSGLKHPSVSDGFMTRDQYDAAIKRGEDLPDTYEEYVKDYTEYINSKNAKS